MKTNKGYPRFGKSIIFPVGRKYVFEGERIPFGYGFAYHRFDLAAAVYMPVPLNFLWGCLREGYYFLARGVGYRSNHDKEWYEKGYLHARIKYESPRDDS